MTRTGVPLPGQPRHVRSVREIERGKIYLHETNFIAQTMANKDV